MTWPQASRVNQEPRFLINRFLQQEQHLHISCSELNEKHAGEATHNFTAVASKYEKESFSPKFDVLSDVKRDFNFRLDVATVFFREALAQLGADRQEVVPTPFLHWEGGNTQDTGVKHHS